MDKIIEALEAADYAIHHNQLGEAVKALRAVAGALAGEKPAKATKPAKAKAAK